MLISPAVRRIICVISGLSLPRFLQLFKAQLPRRSNVGLQNLLHLLQCILIFFRRLRNYAIRGHEEFEVTHVSVVSGEEYAVVARDAREDKASGSDMFEYQLKTGAVKARVFGF